MYDKTGIIKFPIVLLLIFWAVLSDTAIGNRLSSKDNKGKGFYVGVCTHFSQDKGIVEMNIANEISAKASDDSSIMRLNRNEEVLK